MIGDHKMHMYIRGSRVQVEIKEGWFSGTVTDQHYSVSGSMLYIKLDDGRDAVCGSDKCIKLLNESSK